MHLLFFNISELIQEFKDLAIIDGHAAKSSIHGSKSRMVTATNIKSQSRSSISNTKASKSKSSKSKPESTLKS
jgi:hypothetical protein